MAKRHEEMAREFLNQGVLGPRGKKLAALLARVEREAIERAAREVMDEDSWPYLVGRSEMQVIADNIRALLEDDNNG